MCVRDDLCEIQGHRLTWDHDIQVHYFNGKSADVEFWLIAFPNTHRIVSGVVGRFIQTKRKHRLTFLRGDSSWKKVRRFVTCVLGR